jgi:CRP/FNR family transcriptional regulator, cyclic AMP receptor protein
MMAQRLRRTYELFQDAAFEKLEVRLARQVLYLAAREGRVTPQGTRLGHRLRQTDLADLLGATTRSIISILNAWRAAGLVIYDTERALLTVKDLSALRSIIEADYKR